MSNFLFDALVFVLFVLALAGLTTGAAAAVTHD